jgi:uncharacterized membrane protein
LSARSSLSNSAQYSEEISGNTIDGSIVVAPALTENEGSHEQRRSNMLWTIVVILGILWLLGFSFHVGGGLIHLLLVIAVVVLLFNLLSGRRTV